MLSKGQKINDRYEIVTSVGEGGMANVYLAHDTILDRNVALKVLRGDLEDNEKFIRRFQREAKSVSDLSHPNIVEVYDVGEEEGQHYIVMEYIDGKTLKQLVQKRGALTVTEVIDIMSQITDGLSQAHDAYIIHRDIKPQNIMILDNGMIKITDFGIAMSMNATQLTQTNSVMGSVHYLPPEQASGKTATMKSDIYSAGILMYELLTGSVPFKGDNAVEIALKQMKERIPSIRKQNPLIPQSVENIVLKATAKNPKNRYETIKEMHEDVIHALDEERQNETKYHYPYPESELDESRAVPIKDSGITPSSNKQLDLPKKDNDNNNTENKPLKKQNKEKNKVSKIIAIIILIILLIMLGILLFMNNKNQAKEITVPDLAEMTTEEAGKILTKKGFKYDIEYEEHSEIEEGYVIETKPSAGSNKKKGSTIIIIESSGIADVILKDYTNQKAESLQTKLTELGLDVKIEKKEVENPKDYIGKVGVVIDQSIKYNPDEEIELEAGTELILYTPDIYENYPNMTEEGWTIAKVEEFANDYGLTMNIKDKKGNAITDYSAYLNEVVMEQNRNGRIASGVAFTVKINVDLTTYNLIINYIDKDTNSSLYDTKFEKKKDKDTGTISCPRKAGYVAEKSTINYEINGKDESVNCYYTKEIVDSGTTEPEPTTGDE